MKKRVSGCWEEESLVEKVRSSLNTFSTGTINWDLQAALGMLRIFASLMNKWLDSSEKIVSVIYLMLCKLILCENS